LIGTGDQQGIKQRLKKKGPPYKPGGPSLREETPKKKFGQQQNISDVNAALQKYVIAAHKFQDVNQY